MRRRVSYTGLEVGPYMGNYIPVFWVNVITNPNHVRDPWPSRYPLGELVSAQHESYFINHTTLTISLDS